MNDEKLGLVCSVQKRSDVGYYRLHRLHGVALVGEIATFFANLEGKSEKSLFLISCIVYERSKVV